MGLVGSVTVEEGVSYTVADSNQIAPKFSCVNAIELSLLIRGGGAKCVDKLPEWFEPSLMDRPFFVDVGLTFDPLSKEGQELIFGEQENLIVLP